MDSFRLSTEYSIILSSQFPFELLSVFILFLFNKNNMPASILPMQNITISTEIVKEVVNCNENPKVIETTTKKIVILSPRLKCFVFQS